MKKTTCVIFMIILAGAIISFFNLKSEETQPQKPLESPAIESLPSSSQTEAEIGSDILSDIRRARQMLEQKDAGFELIERSGKQKKSAKSRKGKDSIFAKWEVKDFRVLLAIQHADKKIEVVSVDPKAGESQQGYTIEWSRSNGVNTDFSVVHPSGCIVLAIKRVVKTEDEFGEVIYTPYTPEIDSQILRDAGLAYLKRTIQMARAELRQVKSRSNPSLSVAETVQEDLALVLAIIEHIDPARLKNEEIEQLINEVLVTIGANQGVAYRYSVSKANARGLFQFIPRTYEKICRQYQSAGLKKDFVEGMNNHLNAAKATLLLFDSDLSYLNQKAHLQRDTIALGKYLASAYNCGAKRTAKEIRSHKGFWERKVPSETRLYLKKFSATWNIMNGV